MDPKVLGAGVLIRLASAQEAQAVERARRGREFVLEPARSYFLTPPERPLAAGEAYVVSQAFVDFVDGDVEQRWVTTERHGDRVVLTSDATMDLLSLAQETADDGLIELLGDMGIAGVRVSRWELMSAPRRIELAPDLEGRLAPLKRR